MEKNPTYIMQAAQESVRQIGENHGGAWAMKLEPMDPEEWSRRAMEAESNLQKLLGHHRNLTQLISDAILDLHGARRRLGLCNEEVGANCDDE